MPVAASVRYFIHKPTKRIIPEGAKAYPKGELTPYTPPPFLRKIDGANRGKLFPWSYLMSQRKDMVPYDGDPGNLPPLPLEVKGNGPKGKDVFRSEAKVGEMTDDELLESNDLQEVPKDEPEEKPAAESPAAGKEAEELGLLDKLCIQNGTTREQEIINAIGRLNPKKDFGGRGRPKMESLYRELDDTVCYEEMLAAWKSVKDGKAA